MFIVHLTPHPSPIGEGTELLICYLLFLFFYNLFLYISIYFWILGLLFTAYCLPCFFTLYFILCTLYFVLYTLYFVLNTFVHCSLRNTNFTNLRIKYCLLFKKVSSLEFLVHCSLYLILCSLFYCYYCYMFLV